MSGGLVLVLLGGMCAWGAIGAWCVRQDVRRRNARAFREWVAAGGLRRADEAFARVGAALRAVTPSVAEATIRMQALGRALQEAAMPRRNR